MEGRWNRIKSEFHFPAHIPTPLHHVCMCQQVNRACLHDMDTSTWPTQFPWNEDGSSV